MRKAQKPWRNVRFWLMWPGLFLYFTGSHRARVIVIAEKKILFVRDRSQLWFADSRWTLPGGGIHKGEMPADGAVRELQEEVGIVAEAGELVLLSKETVSEYGLSYHGYFMLLRLSEIPQLKLQHSELATAAWFSLQELSRRDLKPEASRALELMA